MQLSPGHDNSRHLWWPAGGWYSIRLVIILVWVGRADIPCFLAADIMIVVAAGVEELIFFRTVAPVRLSRFQKKALHL